MSFAVNGSKFIVQSLKLCFKKGWLRFFRKPSNSSPTDCDIFPLSAKDVRCLLKRETNCTSSGAIWMRPSDVSENMWIKCPVPTVLLPKWSLLDSCSKKERMLGWPTTTLEPLRHSNKVSVTF